MSKPRVRWNPYGAGYWTVHSVVDGTVYMGVGYSLEGAYFSWIDTRYANV